MMTPGGSYGGGEGKRPETPRVNDGLIRSMSLSELLEYTHNQQAETSKASERAQVKTDLRDLASQGVKANQKLQGEMVDLERRLELLERRSQRTVERIDTALEDVQGRINLLADRQKAGVMPDKKVLEVIDRAFDDLNKLIAQEDAKRARVIHDLEHTTRQLNLRVNKAEKRTARALSLMESAVASQHTASSEQKRSIEALRGQFSALTERLEKTDGLGSERITLLEKNVSNLAKVTEALELSLKERSAEQVIVQAPAPQQPAMDEETKEAILGRIAETEKRSLDSISAVEGAINDIVNWLDDTQSEQKTVIDTICDAVNDLSNRMTTIEQGKEAPASAAPVAALVASQGQAGEPKAEPKADEKAGDKSGAKGAVAAIMGGGAMAMAAKAMGKKAEAEPVGTDAGKTERPSDIAFEPKREPVKPAPKSLIDEKVKAKLEQNVAEKVSDKPANKDAKGTAVSAGVAQAAVSEPAPEQDKADKGVVTPLAPRRDKKKKAEADKKAKKGAVVTKVDADALKEEEITARPIKEKGGLKRLFTRSAATLAIMAAAGGGLYYYGNTTQGEALTTTFWKDTVVGEALGDLALKLASGSETFSILAPVTSGSGGGSGGSTGDRSSLPALEDTASAADLQETAGNDATSAGGPLILLPDNKALAEKTAVADLVALLKPEENAEAAQATIDLLRAAAEAGEPKSQLLYGRALALGVNVNRNERAALRWYEKAAEQGNGAAAFMAALAYETGQGARQDLEKAHALYVDAAKAGFGPAMHNLGLIHAQGQGVPRDFERAAKWFTAAAKRNVAASQLNLGFLHQHGFGVTRDPVVAMTWYTLAAAAGDRGAQAARDAMARTLSAEQRQAVRAAVRAFKPIDPAAGGGLAGLTKDGLTALTFASARFTAETMLAEMGYPTDADMAAEKLGPVTSASIRSFQREKRLAETGDVNPALLRRLAAAQN